MYRDLGGGIDSQRVLVAAVGVTGVRPAYRLPGEQRQLGVVTSVVQTDEQALARNQRDVRVVDDEQVVFFDELLEGVVGKRLQRPGRPRDADVTAGPSGGT
jgi:hypothetical protein